MNLFWRVSRWPVTAGYPKDYAKLVVKTCIDAVLNAQRIISPHTTSVMHHAGNGISLGHFLSFLELNVGQEVCNLGFNPLTTHLQPVLRGSTLIFRRSRIIRDGACGPGDRATRPHRYLGVLLGAVDSLFRAEMYDNQAG